MVYFFSGSVGCMQAPQEFLELLDNFSQICQIKSIERNYLLI